MEFRVLGPLEVVSDGRSIPIDAPKQSALLAVLLLHANEVVSMDLLMNAVWSGEESEVEVGTLRYHISRLRDSLEGGEPSRTDGLIATRPPSDD